VADEQDDEDGAGKGGAGKAGAGKGDGAGKGGAGKGSGGKGRGGWVEARVNITAGSHSGGAMVLAGGSAAAGSAAPYTHRLQGVHTDRFATNVPQGLQP